MASFNQVTLVGNITRDPELRVTNGGTPVCEIGLAVNEKYKDNERVDFFNITAWSGLAETLANYKKKGDPILVSGKLRTDTWENEEGQKRSKTYVLAQNVTFLNRANGEGGESSERRDRDVDVDEEDFDDIPF